MTPKPPSKKTIDWQSIHSRLDRLRVSIEDAWQPEPERIQHILHERARDLAVPLHADSAAQQVVELLEFSLAQERYGIPSACVREVCPLTQFTPVPCTPAFVFGIINLRGEIISVIDIRKFFGLPETGLPDMNKVIILHNDTIAQDGKISHDRKMLFGVLADFIVEVRDVALSEIQPPSNISGVRADYLLGVTPEGMAVIDAKKLLADKAIVVDENALTS